MEDEDDIEIVATPKSLKRKRELGIPVLTISSDEEASGSSPKKSKMCKTVTALKARSQKHTNQVEVPSGCIKWKYEDVIAESMDLDVQIVKVVKNLLDDKCTIPFIARYRKNKTNNLDVRKLTQIQEEYDALKTVSKKAESAILNLEKKKVLTPSLREALNNSKHLDEIEYLTAPYKGNTPRTYANRALKQGLGISANALLLHVANISDCDPRNYIDASKGLKAVSDVMKGWQYIIADIMSKDRNILDEVLKQSKNRKIHITSKYDEKKIEAKENKDNNEETYKTYSNFDNSIDHLRSHQVLAINRGEKQKYLKVAVVIPPNVDESIKNLARLKWCNNRGRDSRTIQYLNLCIEDSYKRLIKAHIVRLVRSNLTKQAEKEAVNVFVTNLNNLLLTPPVQGQVVLAIDPGFANGCKIAVTAPDGSILETTKINPHSKSMKLQIEAENVLHNLVLKHKCQTIAIGNGHGCRVTEVFVSKMIKEGSFNPIKVKYCIVSEQGVSIYSVSETAMNEMNDLDPTVRSAVSLCRRLQDPLSEYIKLDPKHLGVGMYQHDLSQKVLEKVLDAVVVKCVSFVGVDLNTAGELLLRKVAGLNALIAKNIVEWRNANGCFTNRSQLKLVRRLGDKTFEQCGGFVKIHPQTSRQTSDDDQVSKTNKKKQNSKQDFNPLDMTTIHPESYVVTMRLLKKLNSFPKEIGSQNLINKISTLTMKSSMEDLQEELEVDSFTLSNIITNLQKPHQDIRSDNSQPLFRQGIANIDDLKVFEIVTGKVMNVTNFGAFVDIGVEKSALIHVSKMKRTVLKFGDVVRAKILSIDKNQQRIGLEFQSYVSS